MYRWGLTMKATINIKRTLATAGFHSINYIVKINYVREPHKISYVHVDRKNVACSVRKWAIYAAI